MTYAQVVDSVIKSAFPEGVARNLRSNYESAVLDGVLDLQRYLRRMRERQFSIYQPLATVVQQGVTVIKLPSPTAKVLRVYTYTQPDHIDRYYYHQRPRVEIEEASMEWARVTGTAAMTRGVVGTDARALARRGQSMLTADMDKGQRSNDGIYCVVVDELWLYPHIESTELISVECRGVKYAFGPDDLVAWDRSIHLALQLWVRKHASLFATGSATDAQMMGGEYMRHRAALMVEERDALHPDDPRSPLNCTPYQLATAEADTTITLDDPMTDKSTFSTVIDFRTKTVDTLVSMVHIEEDLEGAPGFWKRRPSSVDADDGINFVHDATGAVFQRIS